MPYQWILLCEGLPTEGWIGQRSEVFRDRSLITGRGGYLTGGGGRQVKFYPYKKGGGVSEKGIAMVKEGGGLAQIVLR